MEKISDYLYFEITDAMFCSISRDNCRMTALSHFESYSIHLKSKSILLHIIGLFGTEIVISSKF